MKNRLLSLVLLSFIFFSCKENEKSSQPAKGTEVQTNFKTTFVRKNASLPEAQEDLKALNIALEKMRKMDCENPLSWYSQGATHALPATIPNGNPLCKAYTNISETRWSWNTCTHQDGSEIHFLVWHRLYIWHFEKIVRELSGKKDFALPYWDYTDERYRVMPELLRDKSTALFEAARLDSLNNGFPIEEDMDTVLDVTKLFENKVFKVFNSTIDRAPHGAMHNYIGGSKHKMWNKIFQDSIHPGLMAEVPSAGFDPVFWLHHSNIDYLWQKWENTPNGSRPTFEELDAVSWPYNFYSPTKEKIKYSMKQVYETAFNIDYTYQGLGTESRGIGTQKHIDLLAARKEHVENIVWEETPNNKMNNSSIFHDPSTINDTKTNLLKSQETATLDAVVLELTVQFKEEPDDFYDVYFIGNGKKIHIGNMTFFGASHHAKMHKTNANIDHPATLMSKKFLFDITSESTLTNDFKIEISKRDTEDPELVLSNIKLLSF